ncbi:MAG: amidohydrolase family protein, partial [Bacteroidales bacterium]|nr:amidohydrolase family protein [Bacteroidales bacterium]
AKGHMDAIIRRALADGYDLMNILRACILNPMQHYQLEVGILQEGDAADCILVDNLDDFNVLETYVDGQLIALNGKTLIESVVEIPINKFYPNKINIDDLKVPAIGGSIQVIQALDGELITPKLQQDIDQSKEFVESDIATDTLKIIVLDRYQKSKPAIGFIRGFGFKKGAIASSVAHDSHNIIAVGAHDEEIVKAVELILQEEGGVSWVDGDRSEVLGLPVAGIMSHKDGWEVASKYNELDQLAKSLGTSLHAPYMTLSFMALLVIPELKLSDKGLFDGTTFSFTNLVQ